MKKDSREKASARIAKGAKKKRDGLIRCKLKRFPCNEVVICGCEDSACGFCRNKTLFMAQNVLLRVGHPKECRTKPLQKGPFSQGEGILHMLSTYYIPLIYTHVVSTLTHWLKPHRSGCQSAPSPWRVLSCLLWPIAPPGTDATGWPAGHRLVIKLGQQPFGKLQLADVFTSRQAVCCEVPRMAFWTDPFDRS